VVVAVARLRGSGGYIPMPHNKRYFWKQYMRSLVSHTYLHEMTGRMGLVTG
jgi:hypothetical protein